jgi:peptidoglycan hydrolase CwlO-like protein
VPDDWGKRLSNRSRTAQRRVLFSCFLWFSTAFLGLIAFGACSHANVRQAAGNCPQTAEAGPGQTSRATVSAESSPLAGKKRSRRAPEEIEAELDRVQQENSALKKENAGLQAQIVKLQASLADANENIYALNRKLNAIFKPNERGE